ncbi:hypothetical protein C8R44DRAFT_798570 [Mycena epipterygia]|nr:hypothetical protein C8R44DRAFT_798570 [Mycena epipterygia]
MLDFQFVAYGPTYRYDRATKKWIKGSDLVSLHGGTRELFANYKAHIFYMGTYKCHDLRTLCPEGTNTPFEISSQEIIDAAFGVRKPQRCDHIIKQCYPEGVIKVEATGLQCVGFNQQLYNSLRKRFADECAKEGKRKAENEGGKSDKGPKQRKVNWQVRVDSGGSK